MKSYNVASLFCGCGGMDLGLIGGFSFLGKMYEKLPFNIVFANDIEKSACDIFEKNFAFSPDSRDVREVPASDIPEIDVLIGGFPCQSFSIVAQNPKRLGVKDDRGRLFFEMCRILKAKQPKVFIAENVKGILSANKKEAFPLILNEFVECGYNVSYSIVNAADYGVPQNRIRVIIVGIRKDLDSTSFSFPKPTNKSNPIPLKSVLEPGIVPEKYFFSEKAVSGMLRKREPMNKGRVQDINEPCNTVGAHLAKVSLNSTDPVILDDNRYRRFTPREVARIQSFPESFILVGSEGAQYKALGNAVPPVLFWHIAKSVSEFLLTQCS